MPQTGDSASSGSLFSYLYYGPLSKPERSASAKPTKAPLLILLHRRSIQIVRSHHLKNSSARTETKLSVAGRCVLSSGCVLIMLKLAEKQSTFSLSKEK